MSKVIAALFVLCFLFSCDDNEGCPDGMVECRTKDGSKICVPKGNC